MFQIAPLKWTLLPPVQTPLRSGMSLAGLVVRSQFKFRLMPVLFTLALFAASLDVNVIRPLRNVIMGRDGDHAAPGMHVIMRRVNCDSPRGLRMS